MRNLVIVAIWVAVITTVIGIIARLIWAPIFGLPSRAYIGFAGLCLLFAIALELLPKKQ